MGSRREYHHGNLGEISKRLDLPIYLDPDSNCLAVLIIYAEQVILDAHLHVQVVTEFVTREMLFHDAQALKFQLRILVRDESNWYVLGAGTEFDEYPVIGWYAMAQSFVISPIAAVPEADRLDQDTAVRSIC